MSTDKTAAEKNNDSESRTPEPKKSGGLFGRIFGRGRRDKDVESEDEPVQTEAGSADGDEISSLKESLPESQESTEDATAEPEAVLETAAPATEEAKSEVRPEIERSDASPPGESPVNINAENPESAEIISENISVSESESTPKSEPEKQKGLFSRLKNGLAKTRKQFVGTLDNLFYGEKEIDEEFLEELEEILLTSDLGVKTSYRLFAQIEEKVSHKELENPTHLRAFLQSEIGTILKGSETVWELDHKPYVIMTIGVNGVGKTTTIGKLASIFAKQKKKVVLGAADTFRAAAVEQLTVWAERAQVPIIKQNMGADPAAVAFDTVQSAVKREADVVIIDTAGRLHTKVNLMDELKKIQRVLGKALPGAPHEVLLVLDANTGQNAISQAQMFHQEIGVTGLVMTKLDGTAKGGVIVGVCDELQVPVRYIGIGESIADLREFDSNDFVDALFDTV
jgi:fused signal recognition particle receptor